MCFYMVLEGHGFKHGFWLVFLKFPYGFPWGSLQGDSPWLPGPPEAPQAALTLHGTKVEGPKDLPGDKR